MLRVGKGKSDEERHLLAFGKSMANGTGKCTGKAREGPVERRTGCGAEMGEVPDYGSLRPKDGGGGLPNCVLPPAAAEWFCSLCREREGEAPGQGCELIDEASLFVGSVTHPRLALAGK